MNMDTFSALIILLSVIVGGVITYLSQYILYRLQAKSEIRGKAIEMKNNQCLELWNVISKTYQYLYYPGTYSKYKIDSEELLKHNKELNEAIIQIELFIRNENFKKLLEVRNTLSAYHEKIINGISSKEEYLKFIGELEAPVTEARDILRDELQLSDLNITKNER